MSTASTLRGIGAAALAALMLACSSQSKGWKVDGTLDNAPKDAKVALEAFNGLTWSTLDSLDVKGGKFAYKAKAATAFPEVYRLSYQGKTIYFPVDSIETVTVKADAQAFDREYTLAGSGTAQTMMEVDRKLAAGMPDAAAKRELIDVILADTVGTVSYYLINKTIGDTPLFSTTDPLDARVIGAVANRFHTVRPADPRTAFLEQMAIQARKDAGLSRPSQVVAQETGLIEISLPDRTGKKQSLREVVAGAGITLLSFTAYELENSTAYDVLLNQLYEKYKGNGIAIYQVSIDNDEVFWQKASSNLPWVTVLNPAGNSTVINSYYVDAIPLTFVIDGNGDIQERVENPEDLDAAIRRTLNK